MHRRFVILLILLLSLALSISLGPIRAQKQDPQQQDPEKKSDPDSAGDTISVETNLVVLNVTVSDLQDRYVSGLKAADFRILEDNNQQEILGFTSEEMPFTAAILLDASESMQHKLTLERAACTSFVDGLREGDTFAIFSFAGTKVKKMQDFTEVHDVPDKLWDLKPDGNTPLYDAIVQASEELSNRSERRRAVLIASDGADTTSKASLDQALRKAAAANVMVYAIDMTDNTVFRTNRRDTSADVLKSMAEKTGGKFFQTPGGNALRDAFAKAVTELRNQYTITYSSTNERQDGRWRAIDVRVARPDLSIHTRKGYYASKKKK
jgi:Ca-activated chloride channel homolog